MGTPLLRKNQSVPSDFVVGRFFRTVYYRIRVDRTSYDDASTQNRFHNMRMESNLKMLVEIKARAILHIVTQIQQTSIIQIEKSVMPSNPAESIPHPRGFKAKQQSQVSVSVSIQHRFGFHLNTKILHYLVGLETVFF